MAMLDELFTRYGYPADEMNEKIWFCFSRAGQIANGGKRTRKALSTFTTLPKAEQPFSTRTKTRQQANLLLINKRGREIFPSSKIFTQCQPVALKFSVFFQLF